MNDIVSPAKIAAALTEHWSPRVIGEVDDAYIKVAKVKGTLAWHSHEHEDELFLVVKGRFRMAFRDRHVWLEEGEFLIVPRGVEHRPVAEEEAHVLLYEPAYYFAEPLRILQIWKGGMAFHGGIAGAAVAIVLFARRHGVSVLSYLDIASAVAPIGLFLGRIANFVNAELWGRVTDVPWAFIFPNTDGQPRHPSQLYEAALEGLALFILLFLLTRRGALKRPGLIAGVFGIGYCLARSFCEIYREPDGIFFGPITTGMAYSIPMFAIGLGLIGNALTRKAPA